MRPLSPVSEPRLMIAGDDPVVSPPSHTPPLLPLFTISSAYSTSFLYLLLVQKSICCECLSGQIIAALEYPIFPQASWLLFPSITCAQDPCPNLVNLTPPFMCNKQKNMEEPLFCPLVVQYTNHKPLWLNKAL